MWEPQALQQLGQGRLCRRWNRWPPDQGRGPRKSCCSKARCASKARARGRRGLLHQLPKEWNMGREACGGAAAGERKWGGLVLTWTLRATCGGSSWGSCCARGVRGCERECKTCKA